MDKKRDIIPLQRVEKTILFIRGQNVILDADLAKLYGTTTKRLNEQVKRNHERFPEDFMFQPTTKEKAKVVANCDHLSSLKYSPALPLAFTEHGALMAANMLKSKTAVSMSIYVVRAFIRMREELTSRRARAGLFTPLTSGGLILSPLCLPLASQPTASSFQLSSQALLLTFLSSFYVQKSILTFSNFFNILPTIYGNKKEG